MYKCSIWTSGYINIRLSSLNSCHKHGNSYTKMNHVWDYYVYGLLTCPNRQSLYPHSYTGQSGRWWHQTAAPHSHWWTSVADECWYAGQTRWSRKECSSQVGQTSSFLAPGHGRSRGQTAVSPKPEILVMSNGFAMRRVFLPFLSQGSLQRMQYQRWDQRCKTVAYFVSVQWEVHSSFLLHFATQSLETKHHNQ